MRKVGRDALTNPELFPSSVVVNHICQITPWCRCAGPNVWDECCCLDHGTGKCVECGAEVIAINFETGEPLEARHLS